MESGALLRWVRDHLRFVIIASFISSILSIYFFFKVGFQSKGIFVIAAILASAYAVSLIPGRSSITLRSIPFIKALIVSMVWGIVTVLPGGLFKAEYSTGLFFARMLFILGLTIAFDIRDLEYDRKEGLKTVANQIGIWGTKLLAFSAFIVSAIIHIYIAGISSAPFVLISFLIPAFIIYRLTVRSGEYFYTFALDSTIILQFLLFLIYFRLF